MAHFGFSFLVTGQGSVELPVTLLTSVPVAMPVSGAATVEFQVTNSLTREIQFPSITIEKTGAGAGKVSVALTSDSLVLATGETLANLLTIEQNETLLETDSLTISVSAVEG